MPAEVGSIETQYLCDGQTLSGQFDVLVLYAVCEFITAARPSPILIFIPSILLLLCAEFCKYSIRNR